MNPGRIQQCEKKNVPVAFRIAVRKLFGFTYGELYKITIQCLPLKLGLEGGGGVKRKIVIINSSKLSSHS